MCKDMISRRARVFITLTDADVHLLAKGVNVFIPGLNVWLIPTELDFEIKTKEEYEKEQKNGI